MDNRKRTLSEGKTDQKNSRQKKAATRRVFGSSDSFSDTFSEEEHQKILNVFEEAARTRTLDLSKAERHKYQAMSITWEKLITTKR